MNPITNFERRVGGRWTGVTFHKQMPSDVRLPDKPMPFCKAISISSTGAFTLTKSHLNCPGAQRSFGWHLNGDATLAEKIANQNGLDAESSKRLIKQTPRFVDEEIVAVTVGTYDTPDIIVSYLQPENAMRFVRQWQNVYHENLDLSISSIMSVCGNVAVGAYRSGKVCCSLGCPESRSHGSIGRDRLILGVPTTLLKDFF